MITFWNQKEVFMGNSMVRFNEVRDILVANQIKYKYRLVDAGSPYLFTSRRAMMGTFGENVDYSRTYYIYVHKKDYDNACAVLKNF